VLYERLRKGIGAHIEELTGRRPLILPVIVPVAV
jgi:hypothetical protein